MTMTMTTTMTPDKIAAGLRAHAQDTCSRLRAAAELLIAEDYWLRRPDFTREYITVQPSPAPSAGADAVASMSVDFDSAMAGLHTAGLPCPPVHRRLLTAAAALAGGDPVDLQHTLAGLDDASTSLLIDAVRRASCHGRQLTGLQLTGREASRLADALAFFSRWLDEDSERAGFCFDPYADEMPCSTDEISGLFLRISSRLQDDDPLF